MPFSFKGLDHVQITAPLGSETETRRFFTEILGCEEVEKPETLNHFESIWFDIGNQILHVGFDGDFHAEKRGHPAFEMTNIAELMNRLKEYAIPFEEDHNLPGARRFYTNAFFGHRMEFLEWQNKPEAMMTVVEKLSTE
ncbi:MAG: hypothetical protein WA887_06745 [Carnobacterium jeotgali]|uniref:hypothetical protein n=1 Tax=Carnobacterium jeotgali TaxID=545534 RepID=UPI000690C4ED|nr:hypothetical protein [Carnobacterium jeotgali]